MRWVRRILLLVLGLPLGLGLLAMGLLALASWPGTGGGGSSWLERRVEALVPGLRLEGLEGLWRLRPRQQADASVQHRVIRRLAIASRSPTPAG